MSKSAQKNSAQPAGRKTSLKLVIAVVAAVALGLSGTYLFTGTAEYQGKSFHVMGGETHQVLDPMQFNSKRQILAYTAAQKYPEVMDQLYCYCHCSRAPFLHRSLLSCFASFHGAS